MLRAKRIAGAEPHRVERLADDLPEHRDSGLVKREASELRDQVAQHTRLVVQLLE